MPRNQDRLIKMTNFVKTFLIFRYKTKYKKSFYKICHFDQSILISWQWLVAYILYVLSKTVPLSFLKWLVISLFYLVSKNFTVHSGISAIIQSFYSFFFTKTRLLWCHRQLTLQPKILVLSQNYCNFQIQHQRII